MEGYDLISDSYSTEMIIALVGERIYSRVTAYWEERHKKQDEKKADDRLDQIAERLMEIKGKQDGFQEMFNKMK